MNRSTFLKIVAASAATVALSTVVMSSDGSHDPIPAPAGATEASGAFTERTDAGSPPIDATPRTARLHSRHGPRIGYRASLHRRVRVHGAAFHDETFEDFKRDYIDTGRMPLTYREIFFDRYGLWASLVARCAPAERYLGMVDLLFETQQSWARAAGGAAVSEELGRIARVTGLSDERVDACLAGAEGAEDLMAWSTGNADADAIRATPTFLVNGMMHKGNLDLRTIGDIVEEAEKAPAE